MNSPQVAMGMEYLASPFKDVLSSVDPHYEKSFKQAFFNTAALLFVCLCGAIAVALYFVLEAFLRPLLWAALCGAFLYPFKKTATRVVRLWLQSLQESQTPFAVGLIVSPFQCIGLATNVFADAVTADKKLTLIVLSSFPLFYVIIALQSYLQLADAIEVLLYLLDNALDVFARPVWVWTIVVAFIIVLVFFYEPVHEETLRKCSSVLYVIIMFHFVSLVGAWRIPLGVIALGIVGFGVFAGQASDGSPDKVDGSPKPKRTAQDIVANLIAKLLSTVGLAPSWLKKFTNGRDDSSPDTSGNEGTPPQSSESLNVHVSAVKRLARQQTMRKDNTSPSLVLRTKTRASDVFFMALFWVICISMLWLNLWILKIVPFLVIVYLIKSFLNTVMWASMMHKCAMLVLPLQQWYAVRRDAILPMPVKGTVKIMLKIDQSVLSYIEKSTDKIMSAVIILCLVVTMVFTTGFLAVQVHHESTHLAYVTQNILNETIYSYPDVFGFLTEDNDIQASLDPMIHKAYVFGREWVSDKVHNLLSGQQQNTTEVEKQLLQLMDQIYSSWTNWNRNKTGANPKLSPKNGSGKILKRQSSIVSFPSMTNFTQMLFGGHGNETSNVIITLMQENIDTLRACVESVYGLLKGNLQMVFHIITSLISLVFLSGNFVLNLLVSTVVFTTVLFYLLSISGDQYKPVEWFSAVSMGTRLGESVNKAVRDVFGASLKMAVFYGFYTWTTHTLFGTNFTFMPSAIAACLAVVPFMGTYWAALPGALELWLVQDEDVSAVLLVVLQLLPTYVVDVAIYSEISGGGHPYMTGLAVAGGIYCVGLEGALIGPIVLSCLIAAYDSVTEIFHDTTTPSSHVSLASRSSEVIRASSVQVMSPCSSPKVSRKFRDSENKKS